MWTAGFPEPRTFSLRAARTARPQRPRRIRRRARQPEPGHRPAEDRRRRACPWWPPCTTRSPATACSTWPPPAGGESRWCTGGTASPKMQKQVARQIPDLLTVSSTSATDIADDFGVIPTSCTSCRWASTPSVFTPTLRAPRARAASSRSPAPTSRSRVSPTCCRRWPSCAPSATSNCSWWPSWRATGPTEKLIAELGISDIVHISSGLSDAELADSVRLGRNRLHSFALRRVLAARGGGDGQRHAHRGQPGRRAARGARHRRRVRRTGDARRCRRS